MIILIPPTTVLPQPDFWGVAALSVVVFVDIVLSVCPKVSSEGAEGSVTVVPSASVLLSVSCVVSEGVVSGNVSEGVVSGVASVSVVVSESTEGRGV